MSREIKFRAWDKKNGYYADYEDIEEEITAQAIDGWRSEDGGTSFTLDYGIKDFELEQYTGLKDKNDKEIYEGDIVKTNSPDRANFNAGAIVMQQQMYLIINTPTYGDARLSHSEPLGYYCDMECEIVGNIHENPELIGGEE